MPLQAFAFPVPETRFIRAGRLVYKFKIRAGGSYSGEEVLGGNLSQELEDIIRVVLGNLDSLQPFSSAHFHVFPYKRRWEGASKVMCKHSEKTLGAYPFILILYVERNTPTKKQEEERQSPNKGAWFYDCVEELQSTCRTRDSPLEGATLQDLTEANEAERKVSAACQLNTDGPHAQREAYEDADKDGDNADTGPGIWTQLARQIFPFSWFFRGP